MAKGKVFVVHQAECPYPKPVSDGAGTVEVVVGEECECGHTTKEHLDTLAYGHGRCACCPCPQFTWAGFIFKGQPRAA
jgi:hypothetical protein